MRVKSTTLGRRLACAVGASVLIASGTGFAAPAAIGQNAEPTAAAETAAEPKVELGNIDFSKKGSLTINKHLHQDGTSAVGDPATGEYKGSPAEGVEGVEFTIYKIKDIDLSTQAGWEAVNNYTIPANPANDTNLEEAAVVKTGADGKVKTDPLPLGAYLVVETDAPADIVDRANPFVVTLPYPDTAANDDRLGKRSENWLYDVNVFPKNGKVTLDKTIEMQSQYGLNIGSEVRFPVTATIGKIDEDSVYKYFQVVDPMDTRFKKESLGVSSVKLNGVELDSSDYTISIQDYLVTVSFTQAGLGKLKNAAGQDLVVTFTGKLDRLVNEDAPENFGRILNQAYVYSDTVRNPGESTPPETPPSTPPTTPPSTPPVTTTPPGGTPLVKQFWGDLKIQKLDKGTAKPLKDAEFKIYPAKDPYPANGVCSAEYDPERPVQVEGVGEGNDLVVKSDDQGNVHFEGLFVSDDQNDPKSAEFRCYVLVETKAPAGYVTPEDGKQVFPVQVKIGQTAAEEYDAKVENVKRDTPNLPLTGGKGVLMLMVAGGLLLLVAIGAGVVFVRRINE
ncbi:SpaH/EbpB family LPXTG-anchored major pilin [Corynebacterium striatum]